jgi:hypothetical protein
LLDLCTRVNGATAMLVGSIGWSKKPGDKVAKGEELGWFQVSNGCPAARDGLTTRRITVWWIDNHCGLPLRCGRCFRRRHGC